MSDLSVKPAAQVACAACGSVDTQAIDLGVPPRPAVMCRTCGLRWLRDQPTGDELEVLYGSGFYEPVEARGGSLVGTLHRMNNAIRLRELDGLTPGRLLDVGCGKGRFLAAAQAAGWHGVGVEFSAASAEMARATNHIDVVVGDFLTVPIDEHFDAITMWHVLEHLPDPRAAVERAASLLQPGGRLVISVPNSRSLQARIGGDRWFHLDLPRHTYHFTPNALRRMVERSGLAVERIGFFYPEMEAMGLIQTSLNLAGLEGERLYRFAKRDPSVAVDGRLVASMALAAAVSPAALAWSFVAPALGTGASMQLVAQRPAS